MVVSQIFLNLFIAIIIDAFHVESDAGEMAITENDLENFIEVWQDYDPDATSFIKIEDFENFFKDLCKNGNKIIITPKIFLRYHNIRKKFLCSL